MNRSLDTLAPTDEHFIEYVSDAPDMKCTFSCNIRHIGVVKTPAGKGRTALIDAIYLALNGRRHAHYSNRILLVISDGGDNNSVYKTRELDRAMDELPVPVFLILPMTTPPRFGHGGAASRRSRGRQLCRRS